MDHRFTVSSTDSRIVADSRILVQIRGFMNQNTLECTKIHIVAKLSVHSVHSLTDSFIHPFIHFVVEKAHLILDCRLSLLVLTIHGSALDSG